MKTDMFCVTYLLPTFSLIHVLCLSRTQDICFQNYMYRTNFYFSQFSKAFTVYMLFKDKYFGQNRKQFISSFFRKMSDILKFKYIMTVTEKNQTF